MEATLTIETIGKAAVIITSAVTGWIAIANFLKGRKSQLREDYKFAREFVADLHGIAASSSFLKERGTHALTGSGSIEFRTLRYLLDLPNPSQAIRDYSLGHKYLQHLHAASNGYPIEFKPPYRRRLSRLALKGWYIILYLFFYLLAWSPILIAGTGLSNKPPSPAGLVTTLAIFLPAAYLALRAKIRIERAEKLIGLQGTRPNNSSKPTPLRGAA